MSCLEDSKFTLALRLPERLYSLFLSDSTISGCLQFNENTLELQIEIPSKDGIPTQYISQLEHTKDTHLFTVDALKKPRYKGNIKYKGILLTKNSIDKEFNRLEMHDEKKKFILINENCKENICNKRFKLHELHDVYTMINQSEAINKKIRKDFGEKKKRGDENEIWVKILSLFKIHKFWKIIKLADETGQPEYFIREIMKKKGQKVTNGVYRGYYELPN